ncbi:MAG: T9SS type A sorting domain-containing protein, partial [Caldithrix sp.]|nr:T9SS type A sorting domain-containing protein [Caldithrix sp.]
EGVYHYVGVYANWYLGSAQGELDDNDHAILTATNSDIYSDWVINTSPELIDPQQFTFVSPAVDINKNGFGVIAATGHEGYHEGTSYFFEELRIVLQTTNDYGQTWSEPREVSWAELGIPTEITAEDSLFYLTIDENGDTVETQYIGDAFVGTNFDVSVLVNDDNEIYIGFNMLWGRPAEDGWYPNYRGSGVYVAASEDEGANFAANRIAISNGFFVGDSIIPGMPANFFDTEIDLAMDETGALYAAWFDRPHAPVELAEKPRFGTGDPDYKTDVYASRSTDGGSSWSPKINITSSVSLDEYQLSLARSADSRDDGTIWVGYCLVDPTSQPFEGGDDNYTDRVNRIWISEGSGFTVTAIEDKPDQPVQSFALRQNYPNPFNPSTTIEFVPQTNGTALLEVYNVTGQKITELYNDQVQQGENYAVTFDAQNLAAGVYFYKLTVGDFKDVKKMVLIK